MATKATKKKAAPAPTKPTTKSAATAKSAPRAKVKKSSSTARTASASAADSASATAAKKAPAKKSSVKKTKTAAKATTTKKTTKKTTATKAKATPTKSTATKATATKKATTAKKADAKPASKTAAKPAAKKAPVKKAAAAAAPKATTTKKDAAPKKPAAAKKAVKAKTATPSADKASEKAKSDLTEGKKLNVGQKPRVAHTEAQVRPSTMAPPASYHEKPANDGPKQTEAAGEAKKSFRVNDRIVYPAHGVGQIVAIEKQVIAGITGEVFLIDFEQEKMRLRVPTPKAMANGMRGLTDPATVDKAVDLLKGRARIKRTMWSRRAQEYENKINSGNIMSVAEVVRDLYRSADQPEQSYSERQLFEAALDRLAREVAAVREGTLEAALAELDASLKKKVAA